MRYDRGQHPNSRKHRFKKEISSWNKGKHIYPGHGFKKGNIPWNKGKHHSKETREKISKSKIGKLPWNFRGKFSRPDGYVLVYKPSHPYHNWKGKYVFEHRLIMEKYLGRYLRPKEVVHHINGISNDNCLKNLKLFENNSEHQNYHHPKGTKIKKDVKI